MKVYCHTLMRKSQATSYTETPAALIRAAERKVFAHLIDLHGKEVISADPHLFVDARYFKR